MQAMTNEKRAEYRRSAQARLICRVEGEGGGPVDEDGRVKLTPYVRKVEHGPDEVISEGYDPDNSPLGCPVYWRISSRGDEQLYCSTFLAEREFIIRGWGTKALACCDPVTGMAVAQIETLLPKAESPVENARSGKHGRP
jgi:hypothetical protein